MAAEVLQEMAASHRCVPGGVSSGREEQRKDSILPVRMPSRSSETPVSRAAASLHILPAMSPPIPPGLRGSDWGGVEMTFTHDELNPSSYVYSSW